MSGGLDSATVLALAREQGLECYALSVAYGQRHQVELDAAAAVARSLGAREHRVMHVDLANIGGSALTDPLIAVPTAQPRQTGIPVTYVPARNTIMLSLALAWAEVLDAREIHVGRECRRLLGLSGLPSRVHRGVRAPRRRSPPGPASKAASLRSRAPLIQMSKAQIVREGMRLGVDYALTVSCYQADGAGRSPAACVIPVGYGAKALFLQEFRTRRAIARARIGDKDRVDCAPSEDRVGSSAVEQRPFKALVVGSNPTRPTNCPTA